MTEPASRPDGFVDFFRGYAKTWVHAVATAGLTAFGTLTVVHRGFAALALAAYAVPPVVLYLSRRADSTRQLEPDETVRRPDSSPSGSEAGDGDAAPAEGEAGGWTRSDVSVDSDLLDVAVTPAGAFAAGEGGVVLSGGDDGWTSVLEGGPGADGRTLRGVDATADGAAVWVAGDGGAVGRVDASTGRHVDYSAPDGITDAWTDVAVGGESGAETVLLVNGSGEAVRGSYREGEVAWSDPVEPGGGSSLSGVDFADASTGYLCDTNDGVYRTVAGGESFRRVGIGGADGTLTDVAAPGEEDCHVSADDGVVHRYDGTRWTPETVEDGPLRAIAGDGEYVVVSGDGAVHERQGTAGDWERSTVPASGPLRGVGVGPARAVAVGDGGTVVVRRLSGR